MGQDDVKVFGFWVYLMTDLVIFSILFSAFAVLRFNTFGGPSAHDLFDLRSAFVETMLLLTSSFTCALATLAVYRKKKNQVIFWFAVTFLLGASFLGLEIGEFSQFIQMGAGPKRSAFLSSFFGLVGTHGFHIACGLLWMIVAIFTVGFRGLEKSVVSQVFRLAYFWHFLDVVWIFIFTVVYGMGKLV